MAGRAADRRCGRRAARPQTAFFWSLRADAAGGLARRRASTPGRRRCVRLWPATAPVPRPDRRPGPADLRPPPDDEGRALLKSTRHPMGQGQKPAPGEHPGLHSRPARRCESKSARPQAGAVASSSSLEGFISQIRPRHPARVPARLGAEARDEEIDQRADPGGGGAAGRHHRVERRLPRADSRAGSPRACRARSPARR